MGESHYESLRDAIFDNDRDRVQELLQVEGVDVDHFDAGGQTLLHLASFWGRMEIVKLLLATGASLKTKNAAGCTALDLATHWGHSSVAEIIRLRGAPSVWEAKLGHLQIQIEDLKLLLAQSQQQFEQKKLAHDRLVEEIHETQTRLEEEKSAHLLCRIRLETATQERDAITADRALVQIALDSLTSDYQTALIERAKSERMQHEARQEAEAMVKHRDEILHAMQQSVHKQEEAAHNWQRAEVAAAIADSQRNFAFAERDRVTQRHVAALGEVVLLTARLHAAEQELMTLKTDLAEHIYEKRREQKNQRRAAMAQMAAGTSPGIPSDATPTRESASRRQPRQTSPPPLLPGKSKPKKIFSLAAREFGERLRADERRKHSRREHEQQQAEAQYVNRGDTDASIASDKFQDEFVTTVQHFATTRQDKWHELKKDRDRQAHFATKVLARPRTMMTSPENTEDVSSKQDKLVDFSLYEKYARRGQKMNAGLRPVTSPLEVRMQHSFFKNATRATTANSDVTRDPHPAPGREPTISWTEPTISAPALLPHV